MIISITKPDKAQNDIWYIYILECKDKSLYTGITNNLERRINTHNKAKGAKYTKSRLPVALKYYEKVNSTSLALKRELAIKSLTKAKKIRLINSNPIN